MTLLVSLKDKVAQALQSPDLGNCFRQVENWANALPNAFFWVTQTGTPSIPNFGATLTFNAATIDTHKGFALGASNYTIPKGQGGMWLFVCGVQWTSNAVGQRQIGFDTSRYGSLNDSPVISAPNQDSLGRSMATDIFYCKPGDIINVLGFQDSGAALTTAANTSFFKGCRISGFPL